MMADEQRGNLPTVPRKLLAAKGAIVGRLVVADPEADNHELVPEPTLQSYPGSFFCCFSPSALSLSHLVYVG
jgi:hypothetical protein